uniref:Uncharacterized protein n=1 Tax=Anguilla anguilla TaxID=7936 RepID=A0A0E9PAH5_ANGAN
MLFSKASPIGLMTTKLWTSTLLKRFFCVFPGLRGQLCVLSSLVVPLWTVL